MHGRTMYFFPAITLGEMKKFGRQTSLRKGKDRRPHVDRKTNKEELRGALDDFFARRQSRDIIDARNRPTWIWIHISMYNRFRELPSWWPRLQEGSAVVCRSRLRTPSDLYEAGKASPMTCARVCSVERLGAEGWRRAGGSKQWRCPACDELHARCKPCTDSY